MNTAPELYRALWRHRYMIVLLTVVATAIAYMQSSSTAKVYRASTLIRIEAPSGAANDPQQQGQALGVAAQLAKTYAAIVSTQAIGDRVYTYLGGKGQRNEINLSGAPVQDLELMYINAQSHIPRVAAAAANATPVVLRSFITKTGGTRDKVVTINPATIPDTAISPRPARAAILALLVALIFNCGLALLFEFLRDRLPDSDLIEESLGTPVLATIPKLALTQGAVRPRSARGATAPAPARTPAQEQA